MDFSKNIKAFLGAFSIKDLSGHQMFLAIAAHCAKGDISNQINTADVRDKWSKSLLRKKYSPAFYSRAQKADWVDPVRYGIFVIKDIGIQHLDDLAEPNSKNITSLTGSSLFIFDKKQTHTFDKFLRNILANAKSRVFIADSWVDGTIFDNVLDSIPKTISIYLIYSRKRGSFDSRVGRFKKQYSKFIVKKYSDLHDRFLVVDDVGYILGPSIKDAASNSPALVVLLSKKDSIMLSNFFQSLWTKAK